ncbi:caspase family protein [Amycolatopsis sp. NPDC051106]|uniref:caspase family protein n=1 Tax=Amycolatopsis sp. NPDC051106 TaxID=3157100 RepID=UPI00341C4C92
MAGRRRALIVANGEYDNAGLQRLGSPAADADALVEVLSDRAISDFEVRVVRNETAHVVQAEIEDLCAEGRPDDVLLMHFSCHGLKDDSGGLYFAARNTRPDRLRSTAVPAQFVQQCLRQSRSRSVVLLLDCCYGGAFGQGVAVRASGDANVLDSFRGGRGRAVITASNSIEYAFEGARLAEGQPAQPSVFTAALVEGLRTGEADRDEDGWIALGELYEYLFDRVRERNPKQTPSRDIEMQGELYLAKSRRRRIKPSPIPADLAGAITAENPFTRLGAVAELRRRLASDNLAVAMGAFEALKSMAATDIQHVAAAASDALGFAVVRVDVPSVRLSAVSGARASASLRVSGPPVAREVRFEASHAWIAVTPTASGAELSVTAGEPGVRQGKVVVTGPTGDAVVAVEIEAVPAPVPAPEPEPVAEAAPETGPEFEPPERPNVALGALDAPNATLGALDAPNATLGALDAPNATLGALDAPNATLGASDPAVDGGDRASEPVVAVDSGSVPEPVVAEVEAEARPPASPAEQADPVAGTAGIIAIAGAMFAVIGLGLNYRYDEYTLGQYRPGMPFYAIVVAGCALLGGVLAMAPRTRRRIGPAVLLGTGFAALFGLLRFVGEGITLGASSSDTELNAGYVFELIAHAAVVVAALLALAALRRSPGLAFGAGRVRGWQPWVAVALAGVVTEGWITQLNDLDQVDSSEAGRATAYFTLGPLLVLLLVVAVAALRPPAVACAVLGAGTAGLAGVLGPTYSTLRDNTSVILAGEITAGVGLAGLLVLTVVWGVRLRNQPNGRQS